MPFIKPMLANPLPKGFIMKPGEFAADTKLDGHRLICEIGEGSTNLFTDRQITAWSRYGIKRTLPTHLLEALCKLPAGIYDGELLVPGKRSYGVTELVNGPDLAYFIFDILKYENENMTTNEYDSRRQLLEETIRPQQSVQLVESFNVNSWEDVVSLRDKVWSSDGEGLILKRRSAHYQIGKRSKDFIKIKALRTAVLTVIGFIPSKGQINDRGPYATILLRDEDGNTTTVKTRNDAECRKLEAEAGTGQHPAIGRQLQIEFQENTPDGNYRHPRFDHWM